MSFSSLVFFLSALATSTWATSVRGTTCSIKNGVIIGTGQVKISTTASANECCAECFSYGYSCKAFTFQPSTGQCFLKDNSQGTAPSSDRISGSPSAQPGPSPGHTKATRACLPGVTDHYPFCNTSLSITERVNNLISLLKPEEMPTLLTAREGGGGSPGPPGNITRIGLPEYDWGVNCIHGVQTTCNKNTKGEVVCPTSFPNPNALGAMFNRTMFREIGAIIGLELRALWLQGATEASSWSGRPHAGLDCWSPNININRDPRWGRNQEVASEDPYMNGIFGTEYTKGLQNGQDDRYVQAVVTLKHWDAYSLEDSGGFTRHNFDAIISNFTFADTYFPAFKETVQQGNALGVMCSYNSVNGVPTCANSFLNSVLRKEWGFQGYITSDTGAVADIYKEHKYRKDGKGATCAALKDGGCDINSGAVYSENLLNAVNDPAEPCSMDDVKLALQRTLGLRFKLGLFDPIEDQPYWNISMDVVSSSRHLETNRLATKESMILLQNNEKMGLPFDKGKTIAIVGPHTNASAALVGNYLGQVCKSNDLSCVETPFQAISRMNYDKDGKRGNILSSLGCSVKGNISGGVDHAVNVAKQADYIVLMLGIDQSVEGESHDRTSIDLPIQQHKLAAAILALGKPSVVVLINGGMVAIAEEKESAPAILETFYPGFFGSDAIASTIFGENEHLGGKLPITMYHKEYINDVHMTDMSFRPHNDSPGRSYRYYTGEAIFPAFTGISLTTFDITSLDHTNDIVVFQAGDRNVSMTCSIKVTNNGTRTGDEVVFMFASSKDSSVAIRRLVGFDRVHLAPGESKVVTFSIDIETVQVTDVETGDIVSVPGEYQVSFSTGGEDYFAVQQVQIESKKPVVLSRFPRY